VLPEDDTATILEKVREVRRRI